MTITGADLKTLTIAYLGQPFVHISTGDIDTYELDTAYLGQPFIGLSSGTSSIFSGLSTANGLTYISGLSIDKIASGTFARIPSLSPYENLEQVTLLVNDEII